MNRKILSRARRIVPISGALGLLLGLAGCSGQAGASDDIRLEFDWLSNPEWRGKAEVAVYHGRVQRYFEDRAAELVLISVTEPFNMEELVKNEAGAGTLVLKQNQVLSFQTGVYPYRQMNSLFWRAESGDFLKATMTSQEWCGQTFKEARPVADHLRLTYNSYWEGEANGSQRASLPQLRSGQLALLFDELPMAVRTAALARTDSIYIYPPLMSSQVYRPDFEVGRIARRPVFNRATVRHETMALTVGARNYRHVRATTVEWSDSGGTYRDTFYVDEDDEDHRLLRWDRHDGGQFLLSELYYSDYWNQNQTGARLTGSAL
ncbi:MAG: hypothetical protein H7A21_11220 [Spirochaetales bacterium]|nr:hypothetical protein [Leptospiraceae bacterium]MCP5481996.1 hypothetical protein [Spirochaetales bacterium]MCP5486477.1 hypothetical protein [Spirochaetales bacterium]